MSWIWPMVIISAGLMFVAEHRGQQRLSIWRPLAGNRERLRDDLTVLLATIAVLVTLSPAAKVDTANLIPRDTPTLLLAVDVSPSMSATDATPTRLDRAKAEIRQLVAALPNATFALLPFAGEAVEQLPLSNDQEALLFFVDQLTPGMVAAPGSAPAAAALRGQQLLANEPGNAGPRAVILFSDGERTLPGPAPEVLTTIPIHVVPLGTADGSPFLDRAGKTQRTKESRPQLSQAQPDFLLALSQRSGGTEYPPAPGRFALASLTEQWRATSPQQPTHPELFLWLALGCWLLRYLPISTRKRRFQATAAGAVLLIGVLACHLNDPRSGPLASGYRDYQEGELARAAQHYAAAARQLDGHNRAAALRDQGTVLLLANQDRQAAAILEAALLENPRDERTRSNLALALRRSGCDEAGATGRGEGDREEEKGALLSREQALRLIESVAPHTAEEAPLSAATIRDVPLERDW